MRLTGSSTQYSFLTTTTFTNSYSYDANSNRTGYTAPDGSTDTYSYDTLNRLSTLANSWAGSFGFSYDALSRRTQMTRPNSVATNYSYDNLSPLMTSVLHQLSGSTIDGASYTLDSAGNRTAKVNQLAADHVELYVRRDLSVDAGDPGRKYDRELQLRSSGQPTASLGVSSYTSNASNELTADSNASYTYDSQRQYADQDGVGSNTTTYAWGCQNRLTFGGDSARN